jgi:tetratricopeptide (TPR) repeat protein
LKAGAALPWKMIPHSTEISDEFLAQLKDDLVCRRVAQGFVRLQKHHHLLSSFNPKTRNAALFADYLAQWVDVGFERPALVREIVARFSRDARLHLPLREYLHLRMAEGMVAMAGESTEEAIHHFEFVLGLEQEIDDHELLSIANFWKGRCLRAKGEYDQALTFAVKGRDLALKRGHPPMAAVMQVLESWLLFQKGKVAEAVQILRATEAILSDTNDYITLGNIHSSYGRIARRQGRYQHAIDSFTTAIELFRKLDPQHRNVARSLNNMAYVKRLIALQLRGKIDSDAARHRKAAARGATPRGKGKLSYRVRFEKLHLEALSELNDARTIYEGYGNHHGLGSVHLNYGYLHLDSGDLDNAEKEAEAAFRLAEVRQDHILMARGRLLRCMIENVRSEEGIGENNEPGSHARLGQDFAQEATELAKRTQNRRLLADAYLWQGLTYSNRFFGDLELARDCYDQAVTLSKGIHAEDAWEDLQRLKSRVLRGGKVNPMLRAWSQGSVGGKSFQQISEEFAELIIPKVWEREGRKISRVAACLSISPKKVRRILGRVGQRSSSK